MGRGKGEELLYNVLNYSNKSFFSHNDIVTNLKHERNSIRKILKLLVKANWLNEFKDGTSIYYIKPTYTSQQLLDYLEKKEMNGSLK